MRIKVKWRLTSYEIILRSNACQRSSARVIGLQSALNEIIEFQLSQIQVSYLPYKPPLLINSFNWATHTMNDPISFVGNFYLFVLLKFQY